MKIRNPKPICPSCEKEVKEIDKGLFPFCSNQCKLVDLGKWFNEEYSIKSELTPEDIDDALSMMNEEELEK